MPVEYVRAGGDRLAALVAAAAWTALVVLTVAGAHDHSAHSALAWQGLGFVGLWSLMIVAMMVPTTWAGLRQHGRTEVREVGRAVFANVVVWGVFGIAVWGLGGLLHAVAGARIGGVSIAWLLPSAALVVAGLFQLSPAKRGLLSSARRSGGPWRHTFSCLGSCWALMLVMVAVGMGNLVLMAVLTVVMVAEQLPRWRERVAVLAGVGLLAAAPMALI